MQAKTIFLSILFVLCQVVTTQGQFRKTSLSAGLLAGGSRITGDIRKSNAGLTAGFMLRYIPTPRYGITTIATYGKMSSGVDAINTYIYSATLTGNIFFMPYSIFNPYFSLGVSRFHYTAQSGAGHTFSRGWENALQIGIGFELTTSRRWALNTIGNYNITGFDGLDGIVQGKNDGFFKGMIGVVRYFYTGETGKKNKNWQSAKKDLFVEQVKNNKSPGTDNVIERNNRRIFSDGIYFEPGTSRLQQRSRIQLDEIYRYLLENPDEDIELLGKSSGKSTSINYGLVIERARAVKNYLVSKGINPDRITVAGRKTL